ncbi:MAG: major capsid protein [Microvirus sp.]|nr:MAG: major capsid protein [Microvirus sp.]
MFMFRNKSVNVHQFAMVPRADIPRSSFRIQKTHKTTFDAGLLIPIYVDEILPGDSFNLKMTAFARLATPIFPIMDNMTMDSFFFFVPNRLVWNNWKKFMGEQAKPTDSVDYSIPFLNGDELGYPIGSIYDYMGLPTAGTQILGHPSFNVLPLRAYNLIWNEWFRDENLQDSVPVSMGDVGGLITDFKLLRRGKRHDYFTSCLPWTQKGQSVTLPIADRADVLSTGAAIHLSATGGATHTLNTVTGDNKAYFTPNGTTTTTTGMHFDALFPTGLYADLSTATATTINQIRQSFQIQKLLERDARGGTRYTEIVRSHFGVISPDARLQRPEYLGGGSSPVNISAIAQTSGSPSATGYTDTPQGNLAAVGSLVAHGHGFQQSFTEHGYIIGLVCVRADLTYQQGVRKMWSRKTRYDFYFPVFSALGEQAVLNKEIYFQGTADDPDGGVDEQVFGYQERWAEYRYNPSQITSLFRSTAAATLDAWHLAQHFTALPTLNSTFIEDTPPVDRVVAVGAAANGQQFLFDSFFDIKAARPLPMYSVPGLVDHF